MSKEPFAGELWLIKPGSQGERWVGDEDASRKIKCGEKVKVMGITMTGSFEVKDFGTGEVYELELEYFEKMVGRFRPEDDDDDDGAF